MIVKKPSKSSNLLNIEKKLSMFVIPSLVCINAISFKDNESKVLNLISANFQCKLLVVRSSASDEDDQFNSLAGEYESVLSVPLNNTKKIIDAINYVINSYEKKRPLHKGDEVIIQEMVTSVNMSGVIFTHDLNTGAPYYVINYDDQSGTTDTVTSGKNEYSNRTLYVHRNSINQLHSDRFTKLLAAVKELEQIMDSHFLDIEFAIGESLTPYLLQVRSISTQSNWDQEITNRVNSVLQGVQSFVSERLKRSVGVYGETTVLGQMPDWNPVEMIGRAPRALASSLYQILITDTAWATARSIMGYSVPKGQPLMLDLAGQPFIDTRLSLHSFIPNSVSPIIAEKLVSHWINNLTLSPEFHDKLEFEVAITAYSFDIDDRIEKLIGDILTPTEKDEFKEAHRQQMIELLKSENQGSIGNALNKVNTLKNNHDEESKLDLQHTFSSLFYMVDECIHLGTIPFSILARHGFIAKTILLSLNYLGIITHDEINQIQASVRTVASELVDDMHSLKLNNVSKNKFMEKYGHLRPGTYDILSNRYDQMTELLNYSSDSEQGLEKQTEVFQFSDHQQKQINILLEKEGFIDINAVDLLNYIHEAIIGREYGKFVFTKSISNMLELIATLSAKHDLSREEISHVPLSAILNIVKISSESSIKEQLKKVSKKEELKHQASIAIRLPQLLTDEAGVYIVPFQVSHPNFITHKKITAPCVIIDSQIDEKSLDDKIIIIEGADPGFDWIFSQKIVGLITKYGGVNSHMAIRCAEFGIPAAIGCGEQRFEALLKSNKVSLDCASGLINILH